MLYAKVVLGIPVEGPFDYIVPAGLSKKIKVGVRVWVSFRNRRMLGYVVKLTGKSQIKNLKILLDVIDDSAVLDKNMLLLTKQLSEYYCCSWGEAIETALPEALRKGRRISAVIQNDKRSDTRSAAEVVLVHDLRSKARWDIYLKLIEETLNNNSSVIFLLSDMNSVLAAKETIVNRLGVQPLIYYRKKPKELQDWLSLREGKVNIVAGTRSSIFAPLNNLGLVIMDEEHDPAYKQEQVPHYHAREVAFMRTDIEQAKLILASDAGKASDALRSLRVTTPGDRGRSRLIKYILIPPSSFPEIKIVGTHDGQYRFNQKNILSKYLQDIVASGLNSGDKILLFLNRRGFATFAHCRYCGHVLRCPHCDVNLVYHFQEETLNCYCCDFKMSPVKICPNCNSSYIRYSGIGTEKIESELARLFPQARIKRLDKSDRVLAEQADIFISTKSIIKKTGCIFDLVVALAIDNSLNRIDFRAGEKVFALLVGLLGLTKKNFIIQTGLFRHHCFQALTQKDINIFYNKELEERKQLGFPPFGHLCLVKLRGENEERVKEISNSLFNVLNKHNKNKGLKIMAVNPAFRYKLRGKFYRQILIRSASVFEITKFLKKHLKDCSHSGIIVTVDMDPI